MCFYLFIYFIVGKVQDLFLILVIKKVKLCFENTLKISLNKIHPEKCSA